MGSPPIMSSLQQGLDASASLGREAAFLPGPVSSSQASPSVCFLSLSPVFRNVILSSQGCEQLWEQEEVCYGVMGGPPGPGFRAQSLSELERLPETGHSRGTSTPSPTSHFYLTLGKSRFVVLVDGGENEMLSLSSNLPLPVLS